MTCTAGGAISGPVAGANTCDGGAGRAGDTLQHSGPEGASCAVAAGAASFIRIPAQHGRTETLGGWAQQADSAAAGPERMLTSTIAATNLRRKVTVIQKISYPLPRHPAVTFVTLYRDQHHDSRYSVNNPASQRRTSNIAQTMRIRLRKGFLITAIAITLALGPELAAQDGPGTTANQRAPGASHEHGAPEMQNQQPSMPDMDHHEMQAQQRTFIGNILRHASSGTSLEPNSAPAPMLMTVKRSWSLMFHGVAWLTEVQQSGPRGRDKLFSTNWLMSMAQRSVGPGQLTVRAMLSLEPATVTGRRYPELFQLGETAFNAPIVDGQHPHDFLMELAALYDWKVGENALISFYAAPVGDPAMGPTAYPHRSSVSETPIAPLGHHLEDSTHIADDVFTSGIAYKKVRIEASGFHGREPDENRWNLDSGKVDSWSLRLTVNPAQNWSLQYSVAHLTSPEALHPEEDVRRMTASIMYDHPLAHGDWATTLLWGRNQDLVHPQVFNGYLAESTLHLQRQNVWARIENVDRTNELLLGENPEPPGLEEQFAARVQAYTMGYDHEVGRLPYVSVALGGQLTMYGKPAFLDAIYGDRPLGGAVFLRVRPISLHRGVPGH